MTTLHYVKRANKHYPAEGIRKGDPYFWYKHRVNGRGGQKIRSKQHPPRSALVSSPFIAAMMDTEDRLLEAARMLSGTELAEAIRNLIGRIEEEEEKCIYGKEEMNKAFPNGCPTLDLLHDRITSCEDLCRTLDDLAAEAEEGNEIDVLSIKWPR